MLNIRKWASGRNSVVGIVPAVNWPVSRGSTKTYVQQWGINFNGFWDTRTGCWSVQAGVDAKRENNSWSHVIWFSQNIHYNMTLCYNQPIYYVQTILTNLLGEIGNKFVLWSVKDSTKYKWFLPLHSTAVKSSPFIQNGNDNSSALFYLIHKSRRSNLITA